MYSHHWLSNGTFLFQGWEILVRYYFLEYKAVFSAYLKRRNLTDKDKVQHK
jgi:hypothetical protein